MESKLRQGVEIFFIGRRFEVLNELEEMEQLVNALPVSEWTTDALLTPVCVALLYEFQLICCLWIKYFIGIGV